VRAAIQSGTGNNRVADLAEEDRHHPDILVFSCRYLGLDLSTHSIGGLSENDFIMAAKINRLLE
jgi:4a-hydroxytetrahydrobiopterin dehydratase